MFTNVPKSIGRTTGYIGAQYANYVGYLFAEPDGCVYLTNKSNCNDADWVTGNITYITND